MPVCPSCHRQQVVATAQFCPFCGYAFVLAGPAGMPPGSPTAETAPASLYGAPGYGAPSAPGYAPGYSPAYAPPAVPQRSSYTPVVSPVAGRTTSARAVAVTAAVAVLAVLASFLLWRLIAHPDPATDRAFSEWVKASHDAFPFLDGMYDPLGAWPFNSGYTLFMLLLVSIAPVAAVVAYWFSLRRLYQEWAPAVWLKTNGISLLFFLLGLTVLGMLTTPGGDPTATAAWALLLAFYYPALLLIVVLASAASAAVGILFGRLFARWPLERIRALHSSAWLDFLLVGVVGFGALLAQDLLAPRMGFSVVVPVGALVVAAFACWSALRPLGPSAQRG